MKTLKLSVSERFGIRNLLNGVYAKGGLTLSTLSDAQNIIRKTLMEMEFDKKPDKTGVFNAIKGKEAKAVDMKRVLTPQGESLSWNPDKDKGTEIEFTEDEVKIIKEILNEKNNKKEFTMSDSYVPELAKKLEIDLKRE